MTTAANKLTIEREADLRAQKKKILKRLKDLSTGFGDELKDNITEKDGLLLKQEYSSGLHEKEKRLHSGARDFDRFEKSGDERNHHQEIATNANPLPVLRRSRTFVKDKAPASSIGLDISIVIENTETEHYIPSYASSPCLSEYNRKTSEIRKKADERRKNIVSALDRSSNVLRVPFAGEENYFKPIRSASLTDLSQGTRTEEFRSKSQMSDRSTLPVKTRTCCSTPLSGFSSSIDELNLKEFARRQQERLENNLRRVEKNLESTFIEMRKYITTEENEAKRNPDGD